MAAGIKVLFLTISALFPIVDPLSGSPLFLALTSKYSAETRRALSWRVAMNSMFLMVGSYFIGAQVLNFFGVSLPVVQVGGGLVVISMGWGMLMEREECGEVSRTDVQPPDVFGRAFYPLTLPLTVGPRIDFRGGHLGCKRHTPLWIPRLNDYCRAHRHGSDRYQHCLLLRVCGSAGPNARQDGHDGHCPAIGVSGGLYRCADCVEWNQRAALVSPLQSRIERRHLWHPT